MPKVERKRVRKSFKGVESLTQKSDMPFTSIKSIITRGLDVQVDSEGLFGDFTDAEDFQTSMERIANAQSQFAALPSQVRDYFNNDPSALIGAMKDISEGKDDRTREDLVELGFMKPKKKTENVKDSVEKPKVERKKSEPKVEAEEK